MSRLRIRPGAILAPTIALVLAGMVYGAARAYDYMKIVDTYWRVHDEVLLPTEAGRRYIDLFWTYNDELIDLLPKDDESSKLGGEIIDDFAPPLQALVDGRGDQVVITREMVDKVERFLDLLSDVGSPELRATIQEERGRTPLRDLVGVTFEEARLQLVGPPQAVYPLPTESPYR